ncbi:MAG: hypothetical protein CVV59_01230 [Tenericutes bacterium HGW-Tenericutes-4]|nr:MAG: hypothetical protein CVV59_01230 [Tenericutes bacterium HGW-Tenericutes-4]
MPISIILLGVFIIFLNFKIGYSTIKKLSISTYALDIVCLLAFLLMCIRPLVFWERVYVNLGGFFVFSTLAFYFITIKLTKPEQKKLFSSFFTFFMVAFLLQLIIPYFQMDLFEPSLILLSVVIGLLTYLTSKNVTIAFSTIFIGYPLLSISWFLLKELTLPFETLLLGTGNLFEMSVLSMLTVFLTVASAEIIKNFTTKLKLNLLKHKKEINNEL